MATLRYTSREAFFAFRRSPLLTVLSIFTVAFALYTLSVFGLVWLNIERVLRGIEERVEVIAYLHDGTEAGESAALIQEVVTYPEVDSITYISKDDALARARQDLSEYNELYEDLEINPLPASVEVSLKPGFRSADQVRDLATRIARFSFVEEIKYGEEWVEKLDFLQDLSLFLGIVVGGIFVAIAFVAIGATIKLVMLSRSDEIAIMKMVGATRGFIARPFVLEGLIKGVVGAIVALVLLTVTFSILEQRVIQLEFYSPGEVVLGVVLGGLLGAIASMTSLRRHLRTW